MKASRILFCDMEACAYNKQQKCHAVHVNVGHPHEGCDLAHPQCDTFTESVEKVMPSNRPTVELCNEDCCQFNESYQCTASGVSIGFHHAHADCRTFSRARA